MTQTESTPETTQETPPPSLWKDRNFLLFWSGETISFFGFQVTVLAVPYIAIEVLGAGPGQMGLLRFLEMIPFLLLGPLVGVLVDRHRRRPIMLGSNAVRALLVLAIPILYFTDTLSMSALFVIGVLAGVCSVLFDLSYLSFLPALVPGPKRLADANGKIGGAAGAAEASGPSLAGVLISAIGAPISLLLNGVSYLVSVVTLLMIRVPEPRPEQTAERHLGRELVEGMGYVIKHRYLRAIALVGGGSNFFISAIGTMFLLYAFREQDLSAYMVGIVFSIGAAGGVVGSFLSGWVLRRMPTGLAYMVALFVAYTGFALLPLADGPKPLVVVMFGFSHFLSYLGVSIVNVIILTLRQVITPSKLAGRMNGAMRTVMFGLGALGAPIIGFLAIQIGIREALFVAALGGVVFVITAAFFTPMARLKEMPTAEEPVRGKDTDPTDDEGSGAAAEPVAEQEPREVAKS
jgi:MFS family permease